MIHTAARENPTMLVLTINCAGVRAASERINADWAFGTNASHVTAARSMATPVGAVEALTPELAAQVYSGKGFCIRYT